MDFPEPLRAGRLIRRYKRFLADVDLGDGGPVTAHCGNPGSMRGLAEPGSRVWLAPNRNPKAKLAWRWEIASQGETPVGINTARANALVEEALAAGAIAPLAGYSDIRREVPYGRASRVDFLLQAPDRPPCYVEVKSVTLHRPDGPNPRAAEFPDAVTARGAKHLDELAAQVAAGARAVMLYLAQRADRAHVAVADDIDPAYAAAFDRARAGGVEMLAYACRVTPHAIALDRPVPIGHDR